VDLVSEEKDSLIDSLRAKISMLEQSLAELEEEEEEGAARGAEKERKLNDRIHDLAAALMEKDRRIGEFRREIDVRKEIDSSEKLDAPKKTRTATTRTPTRKERKKNGGKEEGSDGAREATTQTSGRRKEPHSRRRRGESHHESRQEDQFKKTQHRMRHPPRAKKTPLMPEGYHEPQSRDKLYATPLPRIHHDDDARDDEMIMDDDGRRGQGHGRDSAVYYTTSAEGDSLFDSSS